MVQATPTSDISNSIMKKYDLQTVQSTPKEIQPLSVANEKELEKLLNELDNSKTLFIKKTFNYYHLWRYYNDF